MQDLGDGIDSEIRVRAATMADRGALAQFLTRAAQDENIERFDVLGFLQQFELPVAQVEAGQLFIAKRGWAIVGLASLVFRHDGEVAIDALLIDPSTDRVKVGKQLADAAVGYARKVGSAGVHLLAAEPFKAELEAIGFVSLGVDEEIEATAALRMRKEV